MKRRKSRKTTGKANRSAMDLQLKRSDQSPTWASRIFGWRSETSLLASGPARGNHSGLIRGAEVGSEAMMRRSRRKRPAASVLAVFSALCAVLLWAGVSSFSRAQLPTGAGSNSTRRTSEVYSFYFLFFIFLLSSLLLSSSTRTWYLGRFFRAILWTSRGHRCRPFPPHRYVPSIFLAHRVRHSNCSSIFIECC